MVVVPVVPPLVVAKGVNQNGPVSGKETKVDVVSSFQVR